jgi:hypothetical protein
MAGIKNLWQTENYLLFFKHAHVKVLSRNEKEIYKRTPIGIVYVVEVVYMVGLYVICKLLQLKIDLKIKSSRAFSRVNIEWISPWRWRQS